MGPARLGFFSFVTFTLIALACSQFTRPLSATDPPAPIFAEVPVEGPRESNPPSAPQLLPAESPPLETVSGVKQVSGEAKAKATAEAKATTPSPLQPSSQPVAPLDPAVKELLKLRELIGSPVQGTVLEKGDDADAFGEFLQRAMDAGKTEGVRLPPPPTVAQLINANTDSHSSPPPVAATLRDSANALEGHAQSLEEDFPARAQRMRRLAKRLRAEAAEILELGF